jgi:DNA-binding transcriptional LysR family regulator
MIRSRDLGQIDLNLIYTFLTVLDSGSVQSAALALKRSQPAVSTRLRQLEADLGLPLLVKTGRKLKLTPAGVAVERDARHLINAVRGLVDRAVSARSEPAGVIRIGTLPTLSAFFLIGVMQRLLAAAPKLSLDIAHGAVADLNQALVGGDLDVVVGVGAEPGEDLFVRRLGVTRPCLVRRRQRGPRKPLRELVKHEPFIGYARRGDLFFDPVWDYLQKNGLADTVRLRVPHIQAIKELIRVGAGISILPDYTVIEEELEASAMEDLALELPIWLAVRQATARGPTMRAFLEAALVSP